MNWERIWQRFDDMLELIIWAWDSLMLFLCGMLLIPIIALAVFSIIVTGPASVPLALRALVDLLFIFVAALAPFWMAAAAYARFSSSQTARRLQDRIDRAFPIIVYTACGLMGIFVLLSWLLMQ